MQTQQRPASASSPSGAVEHALANRDYDRALLGAERLVEGRPGEAAYRTLLGRAYLANGRYLSARTAFDDAMSLGANDARTIVSLALVRTALGDAVDARALLNAHISDLPAADYGLGMAVAGDANEGVRALLEAVRHPNADAQTRQNLAYALALSGNWAQARLVAGQDLDGSQLQQRLTQWAATAQGTALPQRVAALVGVAPRPDDAGLPVRLALGHSQGTALAAAAPQATEIPADVPVDMVASAVAETPEQAPARQIASISPEIAFGPRPEPVVATPFAPAETAFTVQPIAPFIPAPSTPARQPAAKARADVRPVATAASRGASDWVVQIGAYDSSAVAEDGWKNANARLAVLRGYQKVSSTISLDGQVWHRLAVSGFSGHRAAAQFCATLSRKGQRCFVRQDEGVAAALRMASGARPARIASR